MICLSCRKDTSTSENSSSFNHSEVLQSGQKKYKVTKKFTVTKKTCSNCGADRGQNTDSEEIGREEVT